MLGVPLLVFLAIMTQASFSAETNKKAGGETAKISATVEGSTFQSDCCNFIAGEKMNMPCTILACLKEEAKEAKEAKDAEIMATMEVSTNVIDKSVGVNTSLSMMEKNTAATNFDAIGGAGIMPEEKVLTSNSKKTGTKNNNNNCNCASCIEMTKYAAMSIGNSA